MTNKFLSYKGLFKRTNLSVRYVKIDLDQSVKSI